MDGGTLEGLRPRLFSLAYRMLGAVAEAEDAVQDAFLRWQEAGADVATPEAWLVTVTTRLCIDHLRRLKREREVYVGPWLPDPIVEAIPAEDAPPDHRIALAQDMSMAFLLLLERLAPEERAAFLLREVFDIPYPDIARTLERSEAACRQMVHRARSRIADASRRRQPSRAEHAQLLEAFRTARRRDDEQALLALFAPDATWAADGGGKVSATLNIIAGRERIARLVLGLLRQGRISHDETVVLVNGTPGLVTRDAAGRPDSVLSLDIAEGVIQAVHVVRNPDKLAHLSQPA